MEEKPKGNSELQEADIFVVVNNYFLLFFSASCLLGSVFIQEIFMMIHQYRLGISLSALGGIVLPVFLLVRKSPIGFRRQVKISGLEMKQTFQVVFTTLLVVVVIDYVYLFSQRFFTAPENFVESLVALKPEGPGTFIITFLGIALVVPFAEELLFRGIVQQVFSRNMGRKLAFVLAGVLFGVIHLDAHLLISISCFGIYLGFIFFATGNLAYAILAHGLFNTVSFLQLAVLPAESLRDPPFYVRHTWILVASLVLLFYLLRKIKKGAPNKAAPLRYPKGEGD